MSTKKLGKKEKSTPKVELIYGPSVLRILDVTLEHDHKTGVTSVHQGKKSYKLSWEEVEPFMCFLEDAGWL